METYERIKELRKNHLKLSQAAFGEKLGVNRDVINNIENNRLAKPEQKLSLLKLICKEFSVNEEWLLNGTEPMIKEPDTFSLDEFVKQHGATEIELQIMKTYFELPPDVREMLVEHFRNIFAGPAAVSSAPAVAPAADMSAKDMTVEEAEELYKKSVLSSAHNTGITASSITSGTVDAERKAANEN